MTEQSGQIQGTSRQAFEPLANRADRRDANRTEPVLRLRDDPLWRSLPNDRQKGSEANRNDPVNLAGQKIVGKKALSTVAIPVGALRQSDLQKSKVRSHHLPRSKNPRHEHRTSANRTRGRQQSAGERFIILDKLRVFATLACKHVYQTCPPTTPRSFNRGVVNYLLSQRARISRKRRRPSASKTCGDPPKTGCDSQISKVTTSANSSTSCTDMRRWSRRRQSRSRPEAELLFTERCPIPKANPLDRNACCAPASLWALKFLISGKSRLLNA